ncbi:bifunctional sulfate adenylyltransferase/adenylylsulfate kinase [Sulfurirhabdus autotrophica]|uniref:Adenylyl-sulfate kinase n=1 Tax=Sulfurirhabdus autotrophica TaxID=1706046 RepID=A0A4R3XWS1_9PROT|nr:bifunctional sulfate adenylyltransferase/adenylylsulfate kinase [Sulfurirhabdus autotrophica]TCV83427.1 sulfate adenylyltransferase [Sulfurirhabdus autotrophica]
MDNLITPYGGSLVEIMVGAVRATELKIESQNQVGITLSQRQLCDLELIMNGAFSPLTGFMIQEVYQSVVEGMRLPDGKLWPVPIILDIPEKLAEKLTFGSKLALLDAEGFMLAVMHVESLWQPEKMREAEMVYGTASDEHPGVRYLYEEVHPIYVGGRVEGIQLPYHYDFETLRDTPQELRHLFDKFGWRRVVAFHTSKPMHRLHREITLNAAKNAQANILLHPAVGMTKPGDLHYYARVHCYQAIRRHYPHNLAMLSLLPLAVRMAGPREALLNAIIRQNYGCSHFIVGPEHAAPPGVREGGPRFYAAGSAQELVARYQNELEISIVPVQELRYVSDDKMFLPMKQIEQEGKKSIIFGDRQLYDHLARNKPIPAWYSYSDVLDQLRKVRPSRSDQGITLFFTGLSGSGKSTLAKILYAKFIEEGDRPVTLLDGDVVRLNLSRELGFSKEHRDINVRRIGFVASEITKNGGVAICAPIAPYTVTRRAVREMIEQHGTFIEIHVATPIEICESRDRKGLYAKARQGLIPEFTGVSDPYEIPEHPELRINTAEVSPMQAAQEILLYLLSEGYLEETGSEKFGGAELIADMPLK